jgi:hypothetical protein
MTPTQFEDAKAAYKKLLKELDGGTMHYFRKMVNDEKFTCAIIDELTEEMEKGDNINE